MNLKPTIIALFSILLFSQCITENAEVKYATKDSGEKPKGEIAWFPLNGNLNDSTGNQTMISVAGKVTYTKGINSETGKAISLNGVDNYIVITPGYLDTISVLFWLKTPNGIINPNQPVVFDYGFNSTSATLIDGTTGATTLTLQSGGKEVSSSEMGDESYLSTSNNYCLFYFETGGTTTSFWYKGYLSDGTPKVLNNQYVFPKIVDPLTDMIYIGRSSQKDEISTSFFKGSIDEIHVFNRFLTDTELSYYLNIQPK